MLVVLHFFFVGLDVRSVLKSGVWTTGEAHMFQTRPAGTRGGGGGETQHESAGPCMELCPRQGQPWPIRACKGIGEGLTLMKSGRQVNTGHFPAHFLLLSVYPDIPFPFQASYSLFRLGISVSKYALF